MDPEQFEMLIDAIEDLTTVVFLSALFLGVMK